MQPDVFSVHFKRRILGDFPLAPIIVTMLLKTCSNQLKKNQAHDKDKQENKDSCLCLMRQIIVKIKYFLY